MNIHETINEKQQQVKLFGKVDRKCLELKLILNNLKRKSDKNHVR